MMIKYQLRFKINPYQSLELVSCTRTPDAASAKHRRTVIVGLQVNMRVLGMSEAGSGKQKQIADSRLQATGKGQKTEAHQHHWDCWNYEHKFREVYI
jgi:hypothetical protein